MFGIVFIIVGVIVLLQAAGVFGSISSGIIWGIAFIAIGVSIAVRHSMRSKRREEWIKEHGRRRQGSSQQEETTPDK